MEHPTKPIPPYENSSLPQPKLKDATSSPAPTNPLHALSNATDHYTRYQPPQYRSHRGISFFIALVTSLLVGTAVILSGPLEYECVAKIQLEGDLTPKSLASHRDALQIFLGQQLENTPDDFTHLKSWRVGMERPATLLVILSSSQRSTIQALSQRLASLYIQHIEELAQRTRSTPSQAEEILTSIASTISQQVTNDQQQIEHAQAQVSNTNPLHQRSHLLGQWQQARVEMQHARQQWEATSSELYRLRHLPKPTHGLVTTSERQAALLANAALQQDLKELTVHLTAIKLYMLNVWQQTSGPLESLGGSTQQLLYRLKENSTNPGALTTIAGPSTSSLTFETTNLLFRDRLAQLTVIWNKTFTDIQQLEVDSQSPVLLDAYQRIRRILQDYLFEASKMLTGMRSHLRALRMNPGNDAKFHVYQSKLIRAFEIIQADYHRFEFAASNLETPDNFRLDAAMQSARGLRRRSQRSIQHLEKQLQQKAVTRAQRQHQHKIADLYEQSEKNRLQVLQTLDQLLRLQDELNQTITKTDDYQATLLDAELASLRKQLSAADLARNRIELDRLTAARLQSAEAIDLVLAGHELSPTPANLANRLKLGGISAGITFLMVLFGQVWISRKQ